MLRSYCPQLPRDTYYRRRFSTQEGLKTILDRKEWVGQQSPYEWIEKRARYNHLQRKCIRVRRLLWQTKTLLSGKISSERRQVDVNASHERQAPLPQRMHSKWWVHLRIWWLLRQHWARDQRQHWNVWCGEEYLASSLCQDEKSSLGLQCPVYLV